MIPDSVVRMGSGAFFRCTGLNSVTIGNGLTSIGNSAFAYCNSLTDVYYTGTNAEWQAISIDYYNSELLNATIHYGESAPPKEPTPEEDTTAQPEGPTEPPATEDPDTNDPMEPVNVFVAADIQTVTGGDPNSITQDCLTLEDGYIHVVPIGSDPYWYPFSSVDGARYVAIRYRTDATGADIQMYIGSTGNGPSDDSSMLRQSVIADSEWHVAIFDTQSLIDAGIYDGKYVSYFRFDALEAGYILDENGEPYKPDGQNYARYTLPDGCSIDVAYIGFFHNEEAIAKYNIDRDKAPMWDADKSVVVYQSFDQFYLGDGHQDDAVDNDLNFYHAAYKPNWDKVADLTASEYVTLTYWGWIAITSETIGQFGYQIGMNAPIFDDAWTHATEQPVIDAAISVGGVTGTRMKITINVADLEGENLVRVLYKDAKGNVVCLNELTVLMLAKPTHYENYNVPMDQWTVSGHKAGITSSSDATHGDMISAGGLENGALLHQGAIGVGEIDLSKYSKVVVYCGCDASAITQNHYNNNAQNRIILSKVDTNGVNSPAEEDIIASATYTLHGWSPEAVVIDLSNIDYNGPVYITYDTLPGTFMLFGRIEFIS